MEDMSRQNAGLSAEGIQLLSDAGIIRVTPEGLPLVFDSERWGISFRVYGPVRHDERTIAVHEAGHVVAAIATNLVFNWVRLLPDGSSGTISLAKATERFVKTKNPKEGEAYILASSIMGAAGPVAASMHLYGHPKNWEECGDDFLSLCQRELMIELDVPWCIKTAIVGLTTGKQWDFVLALADELQRRKGKRLTYSDCYRIGQRISPDSQSLELPS